MGPDYYEVLQVSPNADAAVIKAAFKRLALQYHPDRNHEPDAHEKMRLLNEARNILSNPERRRAYDHQRRGADASQPPAGASWPTEYRRQRRLKTGLRTAIVGFLGLSVICFAMESAAHYHGAFGLLGDVLFVLGLLPMGILNDGSARACPECRLWWARMLRGRDLVHRETFGRDQTVTHIDHHYGHDANHSGFPEQHRTIRVVVSVGSSKRHKTIRTAVWHEIYRDHYGCKHCGHEWSALTPEERKLRVPERG